MLEKFDFVVRKGPEAVASPKEYERIEVLEDLPSFPENVRTLVARLVNGEILKDRQTRVARKALADWWLKKFGFPYEQELVREAFLRDRHATSEEKLEVQKLQEQILEAIRNHSDRGLMRLKEIYLQKFPDQLEGVEALFGVMPFFGAQAQLDNVKEKQERISQNEKLSLIQDITEYRFLLGHFILNNGDKSGFLRAFWDTIQQMAGEADQHLGTRYSRIAHSLRRSTLSQVATFKILREAGAEPTLSHPVEDAFHAVDLWADSENAIQIKGAFEDQQNDLLVVETDVAGFPGSEIEKENGEVHHIGNYVDQQLRGFMAKLSEYKPIYKEATGKEIKKGYLVVIPYSKFDPVTGNPSPDVVKTIKGKLNIKPKSQTMPAAA